MAIEIGYCTNVHAGADYLALRENLRRHALAVKAQVAPDRAMGIGLWFSARAARELLETHALDELAEWLAEVALRPFTLNGFPHGDFHEAVVKHRVYEPAWWQRARLDYTLDLVTILDRILPPGASGSISTLPLGWGDAAVGDEQLNAAARHLCELARALDRHEAETGRRIRLAIEPEPGCRLQRSRDVVEFFEERLFRAEADTDLVLRYLTVCHDVCHAAVMFEDQADALAAYRNAGIAVGKFQVSSAVAVDWGQLADDQRAAALAQLSGFAEDRYLHQTVVAGDPLQPARFFEDLPLALEQTGGVAPASGRWSVHFHVPVYLDRLGLLGTSQHAIVEALHEAVAHGSSEHFEVETYAWGVLPAELRQPTLADGIAREMEWFEELARQSGLSLV